MDIQIAGVEDLDTILSFDPTSPEYKKFLDIREVGKKYSFGGSLLRTAGESFLEVVRPFLTEMELNHFSLEDVYVRGDETIDFYDHRKRDNLKEGETYSTAMKFKATPDTLNCVAKLERHGPSVLDDLLFRVFQEGDGMEKPKLRKDEEHFKIEVASVAQVRRVLAASKRIYEHLGKDRLNELSGILFDAAGEKGRGRQLLRAEYEKIIPWVIPAGV